jgi:photosystem II stability/assembly factor-like uncharacterized protein
MKIQMVIAGGFAFVCMLLLSACGSDSDNEFKAQQVISPVVPESTAPNILGLSLSPASALVMQGDGTVTVTAILDFSDADDNVTEFKVSIAGGSENSVPYDDCVVQLEKTMLCDFDMSTVQAGSYEVDIWLVDEDGATSNHMTADFLVFVQISGDWTNRLTGLPFVLNDVLWDGDNFIAVGDGGAIMTSADGIDWAEQESGTDVNLHAVASHGTNIVAVGGRTTVLLSNNHGESWSVKHDDSGAYLAAIAINESQIIAGGMDQLTGDAIMIRSVDLGDNWIVIESLPQTEHFLTDLAYANGLFVAATDYFDWRNDARVMVSVDGENWEEIILRDEGAATYAILHDGVRFIAVGSKSTVFTSADGYFWTELWTPIDRVDYLSAAWTGSKLVVAGGITWWYWWIGVPDFERHVGIMSSNGGATWEVFNIDGYFQSRGMAWGSGRLVSVGQTAPISNVGAIYTTP